jgi:hypothetical protein
VSPHEPVDPSRIQAIAQEIATRDLPGFLSLGRGLYVRPLNADISHVLKLQPWKGASYSFNWGVSLTYVPTRLVLPLRFHRTPKSAKLDLWEDHFTDTQEFPPEAYVTSLRGEAVARSKLLRAWAWARPRAEDWWTTAATLPGVAHLAEGQAQRDHEPKVHHHPPPRLVHVLTLARMNRLSEMEPHTAELRERLRPGEFDAASAAIERAARAGERQ